MSSRLALALSASALVVALLGSTPIGHALASQVPRNSVGPLQLKRNAVGPGVAERQLVTAQTALDSNSPKSVLVGCPADKVVLGGGAETSGFSSPVALHDTRPSGGHSWFAAAHEVNATGGAWRLTAYVVCAKVG